MTAEEKQTAQIFALAKALKSAAAKLEQTPDSEQRLADVLSLAEVLKDFKKE